MSEINYNNTSYILNLCRSFPYILKGNKLKLYRHKNKYTGKLDGWFLTTILNESEMKTVKSQYRQGK